MRKCSCRTAAALVAAALTIHDMLKDEKVANNESKSRKRKWGRYE